MQVLTLRSNATANVTGHGSGGLDSRTFAIVYVVFVALGFGVATIAHNLRSGSFSLAAGLYLLGATVLAVFPKIGLYLTIFLTLFADKASAAWYPFTKNFSSRESVLYLSDSLSFNPLEVYMSLLVAAIAVQVLFGRIKLRLPPHLIPTFTFFTFLGLGFIWGIVNGGDLSVAVWEVRPFVVIFIVYLASSTLFTSRLDFYVLAWVVLSAIGAEAFRIVTTSMDVRSPSGSLIDHAGALHMNLVFVMAASAWLFRGTSLAARYALLPLMMLIMPVYFLSERRSAIVALAFGLVVTFAVLRIRHPRRFWLVVPSLIVAGILYTIAFWNATGPLGFPAQAIRSQIAPGSANSGDSSSDLYRTLENINVLSTIKQQPLTGVGFGQKYDQPIPLPDISSFFIWWDYIPHNSVLYIWLRAGFFGLAAMFFWIGSFTRTAIRAAMAAKDPTDAVLLTAFGAFFPMYLIYTYVDLSWDTQSMMLLAVAMTLIGGLAAESAKNNEMDAV